MNKTHFIYGLLIASALLLTGLLVVRIQESMLPKAYAEMTVSKDNFTFLTAKSRPNEEAVFVIDNYRGRLLVYTTDLRGNRGEIKPHESVELSRLFEPGATGGSRKQSGR